MLSVHQKNYFCLYRMFYFFSGWYSTLIILKTTLIYIYVFLNCIRSIHIIFLPFKSKQAHNHIYSLILEVLFFSSILQMTNSDCFILGDSLSVRM